MNNHSKFAEVQYFFRLRFAEEIHNLAVVSVFSPPDQELLNCSFQTVYACHYRGDNILKAIDVKTIESVVSMIPYFRITTEGAIVVPDTEHFLVEKLSMAITALLGEDNDNDEEDGNEGDINDEGC
jgi:hypothetical protein